MVFKSAVLPSLADFINILKYRLSPYKNKKRKMKKWILLSLLMCFSTINFLYGQTKTWNAGMDGAWELDSNWSPAGIPGSTDDVVIDTDYTVTISSNRTVKSITLLAGGDLVVASTSTLTVANSSGKDGISLSADSVATSMTVHGDIICSNHTKDGIDIEELGFINVTSTGSIHIEDVSDDGIELSDNLTNSGAITIENTGGDGIYAKGSIPNRTIINNGTLTIDDCDNGIDQKNNWIFTNNGTITISNAGPTYSLIDDGSNFNNYGTFKGNGTVQNGNNYDVSFYPGSTLAPGTSVGTLVFEEKVNFSGVNLEIEINGTNDYDKIMVDTGMHSNGEVLISGAILNLSGSYIPVGGEEFMFLEKKRAGAITGTFSGLPEGSTFNFNGSDFTISYSGGDGNDITMTNNSPLPVELIGFNVRATKNEVELTWATASETNNDYFTIERSGDGRSFEEIGSIPGKGNSNLRNEYSFSDNKPLTGTSYYRLKQTDFDGQFSYSDIRQIEFKKAGVIKIYPTIAKDLLTIEMDETNEAATVKIADINGHILKEINFIEAYKSTIQVNDLSSGFYFITICKKGTVYTQKFVKL